MFSKLSNKRITVPVTIAVAVLALLSAACIYIVSTRPWYEGVEAELSKADEQSQTQINNAVLRMPPKIKSGEQVTIQITKFAGNYAQGKVTYSDKNPSQQFMAVKSGENWTIVSHNSGDTLSLPDAETAQRYSLPKGWFQR